MNQTNARLQGLPSHDAERWGDSFTNDDRPLVRLADLVRMRSVQTGRTAVRPLASVVLDALDKHACTLFVLRQGDAASAVSEDDVWRPRYRPGPEQLAEKADLSRYLHVAVWDISDAERFARDMVLPPDVHGFMSDSDLAVLPELPELAGRAGALEWLRWCWIRMAKNLTDLDDEAHGPHAALAILEADAVALFGAPNEDAAAAIDRYCGVAWPHIEGQPWTDAERAAMFKMRHVGKQSGEAIAKIVGVTRQRIDEQIGPAKLVGNWRDKLPWRPTAELLKECGVPLQPLQSVAQTAA